MSTWMGRGSRSRMVDPTISSHWNRIRMQAKQLTSLVALMRLEETVHPSSPMVSPAIPLVGSPWASETAVRTFGVAVNAGIREEESGCLRGARIMEYALDVTDELGSPGEDVGVMRKGVRDITVEHSGRQRLLLALLRQAHAAQLRMLLLSVGLLLLVLLLQSMDAIRCG
mmetsp:Transcript_122104/g.182347  ORF Transcript_122104/g.182347 Transcript_122104/m.182347 type:complete len:170 (+) Transcript_122104:125-634(+)